MNVRRSLHRIQEIVRQAAVLQAAQVINRHQAQERVLRMVAVEVINQAVHPPVMAAVVRKEVPAAPVTVPVAQVETAAPVDPAMVPVVQAVVPHRPMAAAHWEAVMVLQLFLRFEICWKPICLRWFQFDSWYGLFRIYHVSI